MNGTGGKNAPEGQSAPQELFKSALDDLKALAEEHIELAKLELKQEMTASFKRAGLVALAVVLALIGILFISNAIALALATAIGLWAYLVVGLVYVSVGAIMTLLVSRSMSRKRHLQNSQEELKADRRALRKLRQRHV